MKKILFRSDFYMALLVVITTFSLKAQMPFAPKSPLGVSDFSYQILNDDQTSSKILEFDLYILDADNSQDFELAGIQAGILVNSSIKNGGVITATIVSGTSEFLPSQWPTTVTFTASQNCVKLAPKVPPGVGNGTIISKVGYGTRICRIRLTNTVDYPAGVTANLTFNFTTTPYATKVFQYTSGLNTELVSNSSNCTNNATNIYLNAWQGGTSTDWGTASNWNPPVVPTETWNVYIPNPVSHNVVVNEDKSQPAVCNNLTIIAGTTLTIAPGKALTVAGTLINNSGTSGLVINSDASGTGSLIMNTASISGTSNRYFPSANTWHFLASPMTAMNITGSSFEPGASDDLYAWYEPSPGTWVNFKNTTVSPTFSGVNGNLNFNPGMGYLVAYNNVAGSRLFTGNFNAGTQNVTLHNTAWGANSGWNLLGNPYTSGIDWNLADRSKFQDNYAYIYDPNKVGGEGYMTVDGSAANAFIGSGQGFFVLANPASNGQNFQFTSAMQAHGGTSYKSPETESYISLRLSGGEYFDETVLRFSEGATAARERDDALKLYSFNTAIPQLYSFSSENYELSVNTVLNETPEGPMALGVKIPANGTFEFSLDAETMDLFPSGVYLEDTEADVIHNLTNGSYSFDSDGGTFNNRFKLYFSFAGLPELPASSSIHAWVNQNVLYVENLKDASTVSVVSLSGATLIGKEIPAGTTNWHATINLKSGVYVIQIKNDKETKTFKAFIQ